MEQAIVEACGRGDAQGWERFVEQYGRLVRATVARVCQRFGTSATEMDDIVGHVYEKLLEDGCRRVTAWRGRARFSTYLVQVVRNLVLNYQEKATRTPNPVNMESIAEPAIAPPDLGSEEEAALRVNALYAALDQLPPNYALIVRMRLEGHSCAKSPRSERSRWALFPSKIRGPWKNCGPSFTPCLRSPHKWQIKKVVRHDVP